MVQISAQHGGSRSSRIIRPLHHQLNRFFKDYPAEQYFNGITELGVVLRVSGEAQDFEYEGPERLKHLRKPKEITIDLSIPESAWKGKTTDEFRPYLMSGMEQCFEQLLQKADEIGAIRNREQVQSVLVQAMEDLCPSDS